MSLPLFEEFPKMPRWSRDSIVTEKIDGTNAGIYIPEAQEGLVTESGKVHSLLASSRTRWIFPDNDNAGFAKWAAEHEEELLMLGPGMHFGEWWGSKIGRTYGCAPGDKRFSLFNTLRWRDTLGTNEAWGSILQERFKSEPNLAPPCCRVVPIIAVGDFGDVVEPSMAKLKEEGSYAQRGFMNPEGIVIFHVQGGFALKKTFEGDVKGKSYGA